MWCVGVSFQWLLLLLSTGSMWPMGSVGMVPGLSSVDSIVGVHGLSCSVACGIFPDQGSNPCLLHWQVNSLPLSQLGSPRILPFLSSRPPKLLLSFAGVCVYTCCVQLLSHVQLFANPWTTTRQASLSIRNSQSLLKLKSIELVMPSNHLILCHPFLFLPSILFSIRVFSNESALCIRWPKYWSSSFNISPSNEHPGLTSFRMDWLDPLAIQGTLKNLLQHHSSKASILRSYINLIPNF